MDMGMSAVYGNEEQGQRDADVPYGELIGQ
jgi:hypothetical protein